MLFWKLRNERIEFQFDDLRLPQPILNSIASILAWMDVKPVAARRDEAFERLLPDPEGIEDGVDPSASIATTPIEDFKAYCS